MSQSIFKRIYSYRQREYKNSLENFCIEILAYCIENDKIFSENFFEYVGISIKGDKLVSTQNVYENGIPDIEIVSKQDDVNVIIECKIESLERENQLNDYSSILVKNKHKNKHLIYLTKYYEHKELKNVNINLIQLRWSEIEEMINESNDLITKQFKIFLKENNMEKTQNFNYTDLASILNFQEALTKMEDVLDQVKPYFSKHIGILSKDSSRSTRIIEKWYANYYCVNNSDQDQYDINIGFFWWWGDDVAVGIRVKVPKNAKSKADNEYLKFFRKNLKWHIEEDDTVCEFWHYKSIGEYIIEFDDQIPKIVGFLKEGIDVLAGLRASNKNMFK